MILFSSLRAYSLTPKHSRPRAVPDLQLAVCLSRSSVNVAGGALRPRRLVLVSDARNAGSSAAQGRSQYHRNQWVVTWPYGAPSPGLATRLLSKATTSLF